MDTFCPNFKSIYKNFEKQLQKNCKKFAKNLQKSCKKIAKKLQKFCKKICKIFAEFLQLHILQKVLHFRPREESVTVLLEIVDFEPKKVHSAVARSDSMLRLMTISVGMMS